MVSKKDKDIWIEDYLNTIKVLSREEIEFLEKPLTSGKNKKEYYFRTNDSTNNWNIWLIDNFNYISLTVEMKALLEIMSKENGCEIEVKFEKFKLFYFKAVIYIYASFVIFLSIFLQTIDPLFSALFFVFCLQFVKKSIYKKTKERIMQKLQSIDEVRYSKR